MFTFKTIALAAVALGTIAISTPAQAHDRPYRHRHHHGRVIIYSTPRYGYDDDVRYYRWHRHHRPYVYGDDGPRVSIAFGGHRRYYRR